ncbi:MAG: biotin/lipoyl-binding protein [Anaerolineales bacterium]|nr:MAG: biotin/lipoyl-binding protein [Anaerolineales bacterium]
MKYVATIGDRSYEIEILSEGEILVDGEQLTADFQSVADQPIYSLLLDNQSYEASIHITDQAIQVLLRGQLIDVHVEDERQRRLRQSTGGQVIQSGDIHLKAPMPGMVVAIPVEEGQVVASGDNVVILESMKMQNELKAPRAGVISRLRVKPGDNVTQNQILLILS